MDVDLTIRYSDDRLCEIVVCRPGDDTPLYWVVTDAQTLAKASRCGKHSGFTRSPCPIGIAATTLKSLRRICIPTLTRDSKRPHALSSDLMERSPFSAIR